jgi:Undecaprenyl-phosphate glucose phosphotransferase
MAEHYLEKIVQHKTFGFHAVGYVSDSSDLQGIECLGGYAALESILEASHPDEVVVAISDTDYSKMPMIIAACEKNGTKLSLIPFYALYMPANPQIDNLGGIPMINLRRIPLDNFGNAFMKRAVDIAGSFLMLLVLSPLMLITAIGVKLSSPGPVIFKQERVGLNKKPFKMYKFRSMRVNGKETCGWSTKVDERRTRFGSFIRKFSIDELPQLYNVLIGSMSLVGPRPEVPFFVGQFKEEVPRYMVKHQVRPGITGWAQVNGLRGDTSILERINHDIYYIENWTLLLDIKILFMTLFRFMNKERIRNTKDEAHALRP